MLLAAPLVDAQRQSAGNANQTGARPRSRSGQAQPAPAPAPITDEQASYLFGLTFGEQLHGIGIDNQISVDAVTRGVKEALQGKKRRPPRSSKSRNTCGRRCRPRRAHKTAATEFLAKNGAKKGVQTTASGLQYKVTKPGDAKAPRSLRPMK